MKQHSLTAEEARKALSYCPETGIFKKFLKRKKEWRVVGYVNPTKGQTNVCINGGKYLANRLAWLMHYGEWPEMDVGYIDGNKSNNSIANLKLNTKSETCQKRKLRTDNTSGYTGVMWNKATNTWQAQIGVNNKNIVIGQFATAKQASMAYLQAKAELHTVKPMKKI